MEEEDEERERERISEGPASTTARSKMLMGMESMDVINRE